MGYIRIVAFRYPWGNYCTPSFGCSQHTAPRHIKHAQTPPSHGTYSHIDQVKLRRYISCAQKFTLGQLCSWTRYHWPYAAHYTICNTCICNLYLTSPSLYILLLDNCTLGTEILFILRWFTKNLRTERRYRFLNIIYKVTGENNFNIQTY